VPQHGRKGDNMPVKMIVTDLDETLLRRDKSISDYTAGIFERCREKGILVVFATARSEKASERFTSVIAPDIFISNGGALVRREEETLFRRALSPATANALISQCLKTPDIGHITAETDNAYFATYKFDENISGSQDYPHLIYSDFSHEFDCEFYKVTVEFPDWQLAQKLAAAFPEVGVLSFSGESWVRFAHRDATKMNAVRAVSTKLGIPFQDIAAFGDDFNDVEMLQNCGCGVAVSNAVDEAKAAADYICDSNEKDGVAKWIEEHLL